MVKISGKKNDSDKGYCLYAARYMLSLLSNLAAETEGVKYSEDIEYVHRCRVATRRLRAAMPVFEECLPQKEYRIWNKSIKDVTRALGEARDADVQIDFLKQFLSPGDEKKPVFFIPENIKENPSQGNPLEKAVIPVYTDNDDVIHHVTESIFFRITDFFRKIFSLNKKENDPENTLPDDKLSTDYDFRVADPVSPGIECLITRLEQKRRDLQPGVISAIESFEESETIEKMGTYLRGLIVKYESARTDIHSPYAFEKAFYNISLAEKNLFWYERFLPDPGQVKRHHAMRISAKKFRYTLETYSGLYNDELKESIKVMKRLQDYLGDIHDCDVWVDFLDGFIDEERKRTIAFFGNDRFFSFVLPGLQYLRENRIKRRIELHSELNSYWEQLKKEHFWDDQKSVISLPLQSSFYHFTDSSAGGPLHIALIGDIHANLPALEAVLEDAKERGATAIINTGDFVGYGAFPDQTVSRIRDEHVLSVVGNYDLAVLKSKKKKKILPKNRQKRLAMKWAYGRLSSDNKKYLKSLPENISLRIRDSSIYVTHGSPDSVKEYINEETPDEVLHSYIKKTGADFIITGHTHVPYAKQVDNVWFINTGSVGRPDDGDPRACYAMLSLNPFSLYHVRVPYDIERAVEEIYRKNLPESFARIFREGRPLDIIMHSDEDESGNIANDPKMH
ncbi:MAG: CHAD domain-containing protein [Methanomicrobiaceae archaeon]|nr:CHAD domain-containing protein [Methanomicrobiaceae archaeon]